MNKYITYGLIFVGGAALGGGAAWLLAKKHYEKIMDDEISAQVKETREWYQKLAEETEQDLRREWEAEEEETDDDVLDNSEPMEQRDEAQMLIDSYTERMNRRKEALLRPERIRYETFSKPVKEIEEKEVDEVILRQNDDDPRSDIYVINSDQFAHERYGFDKVTLYWWELERILTEEDMGILDVPDILGTNWESHIGEEEMDVVYVRNENLESDYEVQVKHESYYEMRD